MSVSFKGGKADPGSLNPSGSYIPLSLRSHWNNQTTLHKGHKAPSIWPYHWHVGGTGTLFYWLFYYWLLWNHYGGGS